MAGLNHIPARREASESIRLSHGTNQTPTQYLGQGPGVYAWLALHHTLAAIRCGHNVMQCYIHVTVTELTDSLMGNAPLSFLSVVRSLDMQNGYKAVWTDGLGTNKRLRVSTKVRTSNHRKSAIHETIWGGSMDLGTPPLLRESGVMSGWGETLRRVCGRVLPPFGHLQTPCKVYVTGHLRLCSRRVQHRIATYLHGYV